MAFLSQDRVFNSPPTLPPLLPSFLFFSPPFSSLMERKTERLGSREVSLHGTDSKFRPEVRSQQATPGVPVTTATEQPPPPPPPREPQGIAHWVIHTDSAGEASGPL